MLIRSKIYWKSITEIMEAKAQLTLTLKDKFLSDILHTTWAINIWNKLNYHYKKKSQNTVVYLVVICQVHSTKSLFYVAVLFYSNSNKNLSFTMVLILQHVPYSGVILKPKSYTVCISPQISLLDSLITL